MSNIDYSGLAAQYVNLADDFINKINNTTLTLYYKTELQTNSGNDDIFNYAYDQLGGRGVTSDFDGRRSEQNAPQSVQAVTGVDIKVRAYWVKKDDEPDAKQLTIKDSQSLCKVISFSTHNQTIKNASYAEVDGYKVKRVIDPRPHGLFGDKRYSTSYWEIID